MKLYVIAGEASGDLHASALMKALFEQDPACRIRFIGGDRMAAAGGDMFRHYRDTAVMGVTEVVAKAGRILRNFSDCKKDVESFSPDALVLVDYPGFNLRMARFAHRKGIKVFYYIAPKLWAHGEGRIRQIRRYVDRLFVIFPFEVEYFASRGVDAEYFGNPLPDSVKAETEGVADTGNGPLLAFLAGSRMSEISRLLPRYVGLEKLLSADRRFDGYRFILACAPSVSESVYRRFLPADSRIFMELGKTCRILSEADAAVVANGTANLEAALCSTPQLSCYAMNGLTFALARLLVRIDMVSLPNIILGRPAIRELLQSDASAENMYEELCSILFDESRRSKMLADYGELRAMLGDGGASGKLAARILELI